MSLDGWHFIQVYRKILGTKYEFVKGDPVHYSYQLDDITKQEETGDYHQLYRDAGWEEITHFDGINNGSWYYFRKPCPSGAEEEKIFTDSQSKYDMLNKVWKQCWLFLLLCFFHELNALYICVEMLRGSTLFSPNGIGLILLSAICLSVIILIISVTVGIFQLKKHIKQIV